MKKALTYLALGDSYTIGEGISASERWPVILMGRLGMSAKDPELKIIAKTGWTADELNAGIDIEKPETSYELVSLSIGVNNQYRGLSPEDFESEFIDILERAIGFASNKPENVFVVSIPDWGCTPFAEGRDLEKITQEIDQFNLIKKNVCMEREVLFVDITDLSRQLSADKSYLAPDGLHYSGKMHHLWVERILETCGRQEAGHFDQNDTLSSFAKRFFHDSNTIYLDGNSLGKLPKRSATLLSDTIHREWGDRLIRSWNEGWLQLWRDLASKIAGLVGAQADEIFVGNSTSVNMYKLAYAALRYQTGKKKIVTDEINFPTDQYILQGLIDHPFNDHQLEIVESRDGLSIHEDDLKSAINSDAALVTLSHVAYQSAFRYDMNRVNQIAHSTGALVLWDLSHAVGAVPIDLNDTNADLAVGCTYKYLNGGPGAPAFLYVRKDLQKKLKNPIKGWFGHADPFAFESGYRPDHGIQQFGVGTPHVLSMAALGPALDISTEAGMDNLWAKSKTQSEFLIKMIDLHLTPHGFKLASPRASDQRGSHIAIQHEDGYRISQALIDPVKEDTKTIIPDYRPPGLIRLGIAPLYNSFTQLFETVLRLKEIVVSKEYEKFDAERGGRVS